jgi:hypothetical protein
MATSNSDIYAKQISPTLGNRNPGLKVSAGVLFATAIVTLAGTEVAGHVANLVKLPMGVRIDPTLSTVTSEGVATTLTVDVGDDDVLGVGLAADVDRYADGLDCAAAGIDKFDSIIAASRLTPYTLGSESTITATFVTLATPVATKKLVFRIAYFAEV